MQFKQKLRKDASIDIASLVDVVFLLLLFFVVTTTFRESPGLQLDLPETMDESGVRLRDVEVRIYPRGEEAAIYIGTEEIGLNELSAKLKQLLAERDEDKRAVVVHADKSVRFEIVFEVLDIARDAGATNITFPAVLKGEERDRGGQ